MASPFRVFRKHQKVMFAVLGVMVMIAFVFLSGTGGPSGSGHRDEVVVRTAKFGDLRASQVQALMGQRQHVLGFLQSLAMEVARGGGSYQIVEAVRQCMGPATEQSSVEKWLFAREAERLGIVVDDDSINTFLKDLTDNRVSSQKINDILRQPKSALTEHQLFAMLREELLALRLRELFHQLSPNPNQPSFLSLSIPPGQRWDYFKRLNQRAKVEVAALPVANYVGSVKDPDDATLKKFFEQCKEVVARSDSPDPGFRQPRKIDVQYLKADRDKFLAAVTDAEIQQQYEKNKEAYDKEEQGQQAAEKNSETQPKAADQGKQGEPEKKSEPAAKAGEKKLPEAKKADVKSDDVPEAPRKIEKVAPKPTEPQKPSAPKSGDKSAAPRRSLFRFVSYAEDKPADNKGKPADDKKADEKKKDEKKPAEPKKVDEKKAAEEKKAADEKKRLADEKKAAEEKRIAAEKKAAKAAEEKRLADEKKAAEEKRLADEKKAAEAKRMADEKKAADEKKRVADEKKAAEERRIADAKKAAKAAEEKRLADEKKAADEKKRLAEEKKAAEIKRIADEKKAAEDKRIADEKKAKEAAWARLKERIRAELAHEKMASVLKEIQEPLLKYRIQWTRYDAERKRNTAVSMPTPPDFAAIAKQHGLTAAKTGMISEVDVGVFQSDVGASYVLQESGGPQGAKRVPFRQYAFETRVLYLPETSADRDGNQYLFWRTDESDDRVPSFDDEGVADQVRQAWKMIEARKLALDAAKALKDEAAKANRPLKEVFADRQDIRVVAPPPFSWLTFGSVPMGVQPRMSAVEGVTMPGSMPGTDFMQTTFTLTAGQLGVAMNQPQTVAYVIRMVELAPPEQVLVKSFEESDSIYRWISMAMEDQHQIDQAWKEEIKTAAGFKWERKPTERHGADFDE